MIEFNWRQVHTFTNMFERGLPTRTIDNIVGDLALDKNNVFNRFCVIDIASNNIEMPVFLKPIVEGLIRDNYYYGNENRMYKKVVFPMYVNTYPQYRRTTNSIIRNFFLEVNLSQRLQKVTTNKGEVYYGGKGIIFDKDFNLLLMCTISCEKVLYADAYMMKYTKITVYIHPKVFLEPGGLMCNAIIKKIIPFYVSRSIFIAAPEFFQPSEITPDIVIADVAKKFIEVPKKPTPQECSNDILNQVLIDNIDDVLNQIV